MTGRCLGETLYQNPQRTDISPLRGKLASLAEHGLKKDCVLGKQLPWPTPPTLALVSLLFLDPHVVLEGKVVPAFLHISPKPIEAGKC